MNIFRISPDPKECAQALDDKRLVKMVLETGQIISTVFEGRPGFYRPTHRQHPVVLWVKETPNNQEWTIRLFYALAYEYHIRFGRQHKTYIQIDTALDDNAPSPSFGPCPTTPFPNCAQNRGKGIVAPWQGNIEDTYRWYLNMRWQDEQPRWTNRRPPSWKWKAA